MKIPDISPERKNQHLSDIIAMLGETATRVSQFKVAMHTLRQLEAASPFTGHTMTYPFQRAFEVTCHSVNELLAVLGGIPLSQTDVETDTTTNTTIIAFRDYDSQSNRWTALATSATLTVPPAGPVMVAPLELTSHELLIGFEAYLASTDNPAATIPS